MSESPANEKSGKKLKQACLPFKLVNSPGDDTNSKCRKRKLSGTENDETRVENPKVELLNGGTKCFIKCDDDENSKEKIELIDLVNDGDSNGCSNNSNEKTENVNEEENVNDKDESMNIDDNSDKSVSMSPDRSQNSSLNNSTPENGKEKITTPVSKKLTPKQMSKKLESTKKQEERLKMKQEKEKAREEKLRLKQLEKDKKKEAEAEAKRQRELEKENERKQKEEERKAKELEKEKERKKKEEEKRIKDLEKENERKQKEEERKQREEEKKVKELEKEKEKEEKLLREEMEKKKKEKTKAAFVGFFKPKNSNFNTVKRIDDIVVDKENSYFMPFEAKHDMRVAPVCRAHLDTDRKKVMDKCLIQCENNKESLYLRQLKNGKYKYSKSEATWPYQRENDSDILIIETGTNEETDMKTIELSKCPESRQYRWKLLQFHENKRPPYWGTWRKKSLYVKPRKPFSYDKIMFDYEIDSDDEWEEEDPGESLHGSDDEKESEDDYEVDNDVFVPHGYLSDEEGQDNDDATEEAHQEKLKLLGEEFEAEIKKKTERVKPRLVGCVWVPNHVTNPENVSKSVAEILLKYRCFWDGEEPITTKPPVGEETLKAFNTSTDSKSMLPESIIPKLITFVHGSSTALRLLAKQFLEDLKANGEDIDSNSVSFLQPKVVWRTIKNIAKNTNNTWNVSKENFEKYGLQYPVVLNNETPKSSSKSVKKITSFMTAQREKFAGKAQEKSDQKSDDKVPEPKNEFGPKKLFNSYQESSPRSSVGGIKKEEQKINIVGGKKRVTPILLSPKKRFNTTLKTNVNKKRSPSPKSSTLVERQSSPDDVELL
ncbi:DNA ligase 1 isoform X2 [Adelges cooleyi]|uniref:DNA ligase 1 isoform X2 n=1 Tax=Adelges cooleyi TaxID=133065 RepID=UPI00218081C1|nr:DNA ligase 1 isoform X2 [Adelges cooleyi]